MRSKNSEQSPGHPTREGLFDDLGFSAPEALEIKVKAELYRDLLQYIKDRRFSQQELGAVLGIHQPDVSNLLNGKFSKFSIGKLLHFAGKLKLGAQVKLIKPGEGVLHQSRALRDASVAAGLRPEGYPHGKKIL